MRSRYLLIPYQVRLMIRLYQVQAEAARIVAFAYETERTTGQFPGTLSKYTPMIILR